MWKVKYLKQLHVDCSLACVFKRLQIAVAMLLFSIVRFHCNIMCIVSDL